MDKISTTDSALTTSTSSSTATTRDHYLKHLNKLSHKISKPITRKPNFDPPPPPPPPQQPPLPNPQSSGPQAQQAQQQQHQQQPPVYNINKNDFRDVVQKLTGSPAHDRFNTPPPIHPPKAQSSRLQRIRPPPLAQLSTRPTPSLECALPPPPTIIPPMGSTAAHFGAIGRSTTPLSPLPPFPTVHAPAESPVSAYMRYLHNSLPAAAVDSNQKQPQFSGFSPLAPLVSPRWTNFTPPPQNQQIEPPQQGIVPSSVTPQQPPPPAAIASQPQFSMPPSPLPFGCLNSPSGQLGFPQLPLSPTVPVPSPRWRGF